MRLAGRSLTERDTREDSTHENESSGPVRTGRLRGRGAGGRGCEAFLHRRLPAQGRVREASGGPRSDRRLALDRDEQVQWDGP